MITCACVRTRRMVGKISAQSHTFVVHAVISYYLAVLHTKWICHFQISQNTPCLYSQILHNLNVFNFPGFYSCSKRNKRKCSWEILGGKQGVLCIVQAASKVKIYMNNNNNAPINVNPVGRGGEWAHGAGIWCKRLSPLACRAFDCWKRPGAPGSGHLTLTDRSLVSIQKQLPSPSLEASWKSRCWRKVWSFHLF